LRVVAGTEPIEGKRRLGHNVMFTFYAQHQLESLNVNHNLLEELKYANSTKTETELRTVLGCFLFSGDDVFKKIKVLSGGEKSRVALAKVLLSEANFLLLDEPTNHLDMQSVNILIQALQQYEGSYIVVSHDRYFVESIANKIWYIEDQQIKEYPGTYQEYEEWASKRPALTAKPAPAPQPKKEEKPKEKGPAVEDRSKQLKKLNQTLQQLEDKISTLEKEVQRFELELGDESLYHNKAKLDKVNEGYQKTKTELQAVQADWEALAEQILELENA